MDHIAEKAPAKVNLTLRVPGRRPDGFHEISSLVVFAGVGDSVELTASENPSFTIKGPFASALTGDGNLVEQAVALFAQMFPDVPPVSVTLDKQLPVAAGLGGGSADAAATLRLLARLYPGHVLLEQLDEIAASLGSDIVVCLRSSASWMCGRGEKVEPVANFSQLPGVLVNPGVPLSTADVFQALGASALTSTGKDEMSQRPALDSRSNLLAYLREMPNDLQGAAVQLAPVISDVLDAISETSGCALARMSGSGPTCFGIYDTEADAQKAQKTIAARHPQWWVTHTEFS